MIEARQLSIFDVFPTVKEEPKVGEWVKEPGAVIPHIMRPSYIGKKVLMNKSTQSMRIYKVGILEKLVPGFYWNGDRKIETDVAIIYDGGKQRNYITFMPGQEIYEVLPWDAYPARVDAIGLRRRMNT